MDGNKSIINYGSDAISSRINDLSEHFSEVISQTNNKFKIIKDNIKALSNRFEEEKLKLQYYEETKMNYLKVLEQKINEKFEDERTKREEIEYKIFSLINNKFNSLLNEVNSESFSRYNCVENLKIYIDSQNKDNPDIKQALNNEKNKRIDNDNEINEYINKEFFNMQNMINEQKNIRERTESDMLENVKSMVNKAKIDLNKEKKNRKNAEENILSLIEETINKINELDEVDNSDENDE